MELLTWQNISPLMVVVPHNHEHALFTRRANDVEPSAPTQATPFLTLHALIIGIDTYKNFTKLSGAVKDAESVCDFLRSDLSVPDSQITKLSNEQATRFGIINGLEQLSKDPGINRFDPILIFYAGHGCEVDSPLANYKEKAQCLVPWDLGELGADGQPVSLIPDYTISALLNELAAKKGNNITVIFDSCHSASSTRGIRNTSVKTVPKLNLQLTRWKNAVSRIPEITPGRAPTTNCRARSLSPENIPPLTLEMDMAIIQRAQRRRRWRTIISFVRSHLLFLRMISLPESDATEIHVASPGALAKKNVPELLGFSRSHVLLAACGQSEQAYECTECNHGYFTSVLLQVLRSSWIRKLKYKRCFEEFPELHTPSPQNPVCEGDVNGRTFFAMTSRAVSFTLQDYSEGYLMRLGDAQGVFPGSKYGIYEDFIIPKGFTSDRLPSPGLDRPLWGKFKAEPCLLSGLDPMLYPFYSWCQLGGNTRLPSWPRAKLLKLGRRGAASLRVFFSDALKLVLDPKSVVRANQGMVLVDTVDPNDTSTAMLDIETGRNGLVTFRLAGLPEVLHKCYPDAERAHRILVSMAQWRWHCSREPHGLLSNKPMARMTMFELGQAGATPLQTEEDGSVIAKVSPKTLYALKVTSLYSRPLYAYLFYLSTARQSIRPLYLGVYGSRRIDPPLEPHGELTIGFNNDDMIPGALSFARTSDEGYFQIFLTTSPADFDSVAQSSPFTEFQMFCDMTTGSGDEYGDGLEIRRYQSSGSPTVLSSHPTTPGGFGAFDAHSTEILATQALQIVVPERQQTGVPGGLDNSVRDFRPPSEVAELFTAHAMQLQLWGVIRLKVKCRNFEA